MPDAQLPPHPAPDPVPHVNAATEAQRAARMAILVRIWVISALLVLALVGMAVTQASKEQAWIVWICVVSMYGLVCIWHSYAGSRRRGESIARTLWQQLFHWVVVLFFVKILIVMEKSGYLEKEASGPVSLVVLAMGCVLAGVHFDWLFLIVGSLLAVAAFVQEQVVLYLPYILAPLIVVGIVAVYLMYRRSRSP